MKKKNDLSPHLRIAAFFVIVAVAVFGLVMLWKRLPKSPLTPKSLPSTAQQSPTFTIPEIKNREGLTKTSCEAARGHWVECGSPCHGHRSDICIQMCEPQCLCGGIAGWQCPSNTVCTDWEPDLQVPDALGVCRSSHVTSSTLHVPPPLGMICDETNSICVNKSYQNILLENPVSVTGTAIAFESTIQWEMHDSSGLNRSVGGGTLMTQALDVGQPGLFVLRGFFDAVPSATTGTLTFYERSAKDGSPIHLLHIPVRFSTETMSTKIYVSAEDGTQCQKTKEITIQMPRTLFPVEATLRQLLRRMTNPANVDLISLNVSGGVAKAVFSPNLDVGGGACHVASVRAQIEDTLKQFSVVKKGEISVPGKSPAETLQP